MVVRSGNETIVRYNRGLTVALRVVGSILVPLGLAAIGATISDPDRWSWPGALLFGLGSFFVAWKAFSLAGAFSRCFVAVGPEGVRLRLLNKDGAKYSPIAEQRFGWDEIGRLTYDSDKGICRFRARDSDYELTDDNSPSPRTVAKWIAERKGVQLSSHESLVPPAQRPIPGRQQAAVAGGIGLCLTGIVAAGAWWLHSHPKTSHFDDEVVVLAMIGLFAIIALIVAVALALADAAHRL